MWSVTNVVNCMQLHGKTQPQMSKKILLKILNISTQ